MQHLVSPVGIVRSCFKEKFAIPRQLVADANVIAVEHTALPQPHLQLEIELLLLEDC